MVEDLPDLTPEEAAQPATRGDVRAHLEEIARYRQDLARYLPRDEATRIRRRVTFTIVTSVLLALLLTTFGNNAAVSYCFLSGSADGLRVSPVCDAMFPGRSDAVERNRRNLDDFRELLRTIPENRARIEQLEQRVAKLEAE